MKYQSEYKRQSTQVIHPGFETQGTRHQKSKTGLSVAPRKILYALQKILKTKKSEESDVISGMILSVDRASPRLGLQCRFHRNYPRQSIYHTLLLVSTIGEWMCQFPFRVKVQGSNNPCKCINFKIYFFSRVLKG